MPSSRGSSYPGIEPRYPTLQADSLPAEPQGKTLEKTLESPLDSKGSNQSILKEINPEYLLEGLMLKLKLQYSGHLMGRADSSEKPLRL